MSWKDQIDCFLNVHSICHCRTTRAYNKFFVCFFTIFFAQMYRHLQFFPFIYLFGEPELFQHFFGQIFKGAGKETPLKWHQSPFLHDVPHFQFRSSTKTDPCRWMSRGRRDFEGGCHKGGQFAADKLRQFWAFGVFVPTSSGCPLVCLSSARGLMCLSSPPAHKNIWAAENP